MSLLRRLFNRLINTLTPRRSDERLKEEIAEHLALQTADNTRAGLSPAEARRQAILKFGAVESIKENYRAHRGLLFLETLVRDFGYALRMVRKDPGFSAVAILTLALGIGVNTTLFTAYDAIALKPLPVTHPSDVVVFERWFQDSFRGSYGFSYPEYLYWLSHENSFSSLVAATALVPVHGSSNGTASTEAILGQLVSANYFTALGIRPQLGRIFAAGEDQNPGGNNLLVISYAYWQRAFQGNKNVIGQGITLDDEAFTIVGVAPRQFTGTAPGARTPSFWAPLSMSNQILRGGDRLEDRLEDPNGHFFEIFARLKDSVPRRSAQAEADLLIRQFETTYTELHKTTAVTLSPTTYFPQTDDIRFRAAVAAAVLIVGLILFVACVNVGNMLLARAAERHREIGMRRAFGASRFRIIRQLMAESILLAFFGGVAGIVASIWSTELLGAYLQSKAAFLLGDISAINLSVDARVVGYALAVSLCAGFLLGLSPALQFTKQDLATAVKDESPSVGNLSGSRLRSVLIVAQVAASVFLVAMAGLLTRGMIRSQAAHLDFDVRNDFVVGANFGVNLQRNPTTGMAAAMMAREKQLVTSMQGRPEFADVILGSAPQDASTPAIVVGQTRARTVASVASDTYFNFFGIPFLRGRNFTPQESNDGAHLAIISESTARLLWPHQDPIGRSFDLDMDFRGTFETFQVIGIVKDVHYENLSRVDPAHVYLTPGSNVNYSGLTEVIAKIYGDSRSATAAVATLAGSFDKDSFTDVQLISIEDKVSEWRALPQMLALFAAILAALAVTLAAIGIYGVLSYLVTQRTKEIGIRIALGATPVGLLRNIVFVALQPVFAGMILGLVVAAIASALLHQTLIFPGSIDVLYGVPFYDPLTFAGLLFFGICIGALASLVPARRAMRVDPMVALRYE